MNKLTIARRWFPSGSRRRRIYDRIFLPLGDSYPPREGLIAELAQWRDGPRSGASRAEEILREARDLTRSLDNRVASAERRATTLQGATALAMTLLVAGGAILASPAGIRGPVWRVSLGMLLALVVFFLVASGLRALQATSTIHKFAQPDVDGLISRAKGPLATAKVSLAADLIRSYDRNVRIADWKVAQLRASAYWLRLAMLAFLLLAAELGVYLCLPLSH